MRNTTIDWAFDDIRAARRLWPRVSSLVDEECSRRQLAIDVREKRRITAAVVSDLLTQGGAGRSPDQILARLAGRVRHWLKPSAGRPQSLRRYLQNC